MTPAQKIQLRLSEVRVRLNAISALDGEAFTDEIRTEAETLQAEYRDLEVRHRSAIIAEPEGATREVAVDAEMRERIELRSRAMLSNYLLAAARGRLPSGAEAELQQAAGVSGIPLELWDIPQPAETRAVTPAPGTVGVNLEPIRPAVFANSIAPRLGIEMPRVASGTYASATVSSSQTAAALAKGTDATGTAGAFTVTTSTPKRVSARLELLLEDIAAVGTGNFESILLENLSLVLSAELDDQMVNGDGQSNNLTGIFQRLTDPTAAPSAVTNFDGFVSSFADGIDGLWASTVKDVAIVAGVDSYKLSAKTFRDVASADLGDMAFSDYAMAHYGGWWTNSRMPVPATFMSVDNVQQAILYRMGRSIMGGSGGMRTAVCAHWNEVSIDDIYSGSARGERAFTMHVLLGDVILTQPNAYAQVAFRTA